MRWISSCLPIYGWSQAGHQVDLFSPTDGSVRETGSSSLQSLCIFFKILLFSNADFRSSAVFHFFYTATRLLYASTPFLLSSPSLCSWSPWTLPLIALPQTWSLSVSLGQTTFCSKLYSTLRCTHSKQPLPPSNILRMHIALIKKRQMGLLMWYTPCYFSLHTDGQSIHKPCSLCV